jgi:hypothetical protein
MGDGENFCPSPSVSTVSSVDSVCYSWYKLKMGTKFDGLWSEKGYPHKGWTYVGCIDLGKLEGVCDFCGTAYRYEHSIEHFDAALSVNVGCVCAEKLCEDYKTPKKSEAKIVSSAKREAAKKKKEDAKERADRERYLRSFQVNSKGNFCFAKVTVFRSAGGWKSVFEDHFSPVFCKRTDAALFHFHNWKKRFSF